ncbi:MAG: Regulatory protein [Pedosphaera sp.]|nr:Regulatory protein [Pedosphaera sp.]
MHPKTVRSQPAQDPRIGNTRSPRSSAATLGAAVFSEQAWVEIARTLNLSGRELQIIQGVFDNNTEFSIAANLAISPHTVHTHFERLHHKLAVTNRVQLVLRVVDEFLALRAPTPVWNEKPTPFGGGTVAYCPLNDA